MRTKIISTFYQISIISLLSIQCLFAQQKEVNLNTAIQKEVINNACENFRKYYIFPEVADQMINYVKEQEKNNKYLKLSNPDEFAKQLTSDFQSVSKDKHIMVRYSPEILPVEEVNDKKEMPKDFAEFLLKKNYGFEKVEIMDGNIGYIKLNAFAPGDLAGETAVAAMNFIANTDALIIDLRSNSGGMPDILVLMISYLFNGNPVHLNDTYWRNDNKTLQSWTLPYIPGKRYGINKDVYVLTSNRTFSAAEEFSYDLQTLKRAKIIGETTGGGANPGSFYRLNDHFSIFVPEGRAINPITKTNWEGVGVKPDIETSKEDALITAHITALRSFLEKETDEKKKNDLKGKIDRYEKEAKGISQAK